LEQNFDLLRGITKLHRACRQDLYFYTACIVLVNCSLHFVSPHDQTANTTTHNGPYHCNSSNFALVYAR